MNMISHLFVHLTACQALQTHPDKRDMAEVEGMDRVLDSHEARCPMSRLVTPL